jgi:hypothetical protein
MNRKALYSNKGGTHYNDTYEGGDYSNKQLSTYNNEFGYGYKNSGT